jgi:hypothetical protein
VIEWRLFSKLRSCFRFIALKIETSLKLINQKRLMHVKSSSLPSILSTSTDTPWSKRFVKKAWKNIWKICRGWCCVLLIIWGAFGPIRPPRWKNHPAEEWGVCVTVVPNALVLYFHGCALSAHTRACVRVSISVSATHLWFAATPLSLSGSGTVYFSDSQSHRNTR